MPTPQPIPFWTQSYEGRTKKVTAEELVNWYLEANPQNAKFPYVLCPTPGLKLLTTVGDGPHRGCTKLGEDLFCVSGTRLYVVHSDLSILEVGEIAGTGNVRMAASDTQVIIATDEHFYCATASSILDLPEMFMCGVAYQDGYGIAAQAGTNKFWISATDNLASWAGGDVMNADAKADCVTGLASAHRLVWVFKGETIEGWYNSGAAAFPFQRVESGFLEVGCMAPHSIAILGDQLFWVGHDHKVYTAKGFSPQEISTPGITAFIEARNSPQTALAWAYTQAGHTFYVLTFGDKTMVYDTSTGLWHYRKSQGISRWRANSHEYIWRKHVVGDYENGKLYQLDLKTYADDGAEIRREATSAPIAQGGSMLSMPELFVDMKMGVGLDGLSDWGMPGFVQGSDPKLLLSWSDDGGETFGNELELSIGKIGERLKQARVNRLGAFRERAIRIAVSDPIEAIVIGAYARMEVLDV